jgi:CRP-like cAMP-binding protein
MTHLEHLALIQAQAHSRHWEKPTPDDWANVLATFPLFTGISKRRLRKLARSATVAEYARGETIILTGDRDNVLHVILDGEAKAISRPAARALRTGDYFGEVALLDGRPRSATVVATSDVHALKLPAHSVLRLAQDKPVITLTMFKHLATQLRNIETQTARAT